MRSKESGIFSFLMVLALCSFLSYGQAIAQELEQASSSISSFWLWRFLGRLHPLAVHFPVALLIFSAFLELITFRNFNSKLRPGINWLVMAGATGSVIAALFGWMLASTEEYGGELLQIHKWSGVATVLLSLIVLYWLYLILYKGLLNFVRYYRLSLLLLAFGVSIAGHFGASLTHGEDFLAQVLPWDEKYVSNEGVSFDMAAYQLDSGGMDLEQELKLVGNVRAIFAHNCYSCHSSEKIKGELRLDQKDFVFKGGESGPIFIPGNPENSEVLRRVSLPKGHKEVMPSKGKSLSDDEIALLRFWIEKGAPWPEGAEQQSVFRKASLKPRKPELPLARSGFENPIDIWVTEYFKENNISWKQDVDDKTFLRRIYLDIIGLIPSPEEIDEFLNDTRPDKHAIWVRKLLDKDDAYAMHWLSFWNDVLRNDYTGTGYITNGRYNITDWLYKSLKENKPYDQFVKQLLNPDESSKGFIEGIRWRGTVNASQRTEMQAAQNVGQVILGLNLKCASCHDSFISDWKLEEAYAFANIFADSTLEVSRCEKPTGKLASTRILWEELGEIDSTATRSKKLEQLADYLVQPANGRMYRTLVNRIWKQMMGRGMVEPVDEMDNEPWSQDLLDWMASEFVDQGYDLKELIYLIATSKIYRSPSVGVDNPAVLASDDFVFEGMIRRRVSAEQFSDAVSQLISPVFDEEELKYKPFELLEKEHGDLTFPRASLVANNRFLTALGRPNREVVSTSRDSQASLLQALELTNGERLNSALQKGANQWQQKYQDGDIIIQELYNKAFGRSPSPKEIQIAKAALGETPDPGQIQDFFWAVLLLPEFQLIY